MNLNETLEALAEHVQATGVRIIYGEPHSAEGRTIIPVARVTYGFGGGGGPLAKRAGRSRDLIGEGAGGGGGVHAVPVGIIEITREQTRFLRFADRRPLVAAATIGFGLGVMLSQWAGRRRRRD